MARFMDHNTPEWSQAWTALANSQPTPFEGDPACEYAATGEVWEYMGTTDGEGHQFRHRQHPGYGGARALFTVWLGYGVARVSRGVSYPGFDRVAPLTQTDTVDVYACA